MSSASNRNFSHTLCIFAEYEIRFYITLTDYIKLKRIFYKTSLIQAHTHTNVSKCSSLFTRHIACNQLASDKQLRAQVAWAGPMLMCLIRTIGSQCEAALEIWQRYRTFPLWHSGHFLSDLLFFSDKSQWLNAELRWAITLWEHNYLNT